MGSRIHQHSSQVGNQSPVTGNQGVHGIDTPSHEKLNAPSSESGWWPDAGGQKNPREAVFSWKYD
jgi:hypothetical protein